jgi:hypothetical protein
MSMDEISLVDEFNTIYWMNFMYEWFISKCNDINIDKWKMTQLDEVFPR